MNQLAQCANCPTRYYIDLDQLARGISRKACPVCGVITDFADEQQANPYASQGTKDLWAAVGTGFVLLGLYVAYKTIDKALTA